MIDYDRTSWWRTCLAIHGTVLPHVLGRVGLLTGFSLILCLIDEYILDYFGTELPALDQLGHTVLGISMGMLIVFRTNSSYTRYWEARTYWGSIINNSRNLIRLAAAYVGTANEFARLLVAYVRGLKLTLRDSRDFSELRPLISAELYERIVPLANPCPVLAAELSKWIAGRQKDHTLEPLMGLEMEQLVDKLVDAQGGCERIQKTPLPFVYVVLIRQLLLLYLGSLPFVLIAKMHFAAPLAVAVVSLGMLGIEEAGVEIENPFNLSPNGLPLDRFCKTIARDAATMLQQGATEMESASTG